MSSGVTILRFVLVDSADQEEDVEYIDLVAATTRAQAEGKAVIQRIYEYVDSELIWTPDEAFRPTNPWPPKKFE